MSVKIKKGSTRWVILTKRYAVKVPSLYSWTNFLWGLLANMQEVRFSKVEAFSDKVCPVLFSIPLGFLLIMPKVKILTGPEFLAFNAEGFLMCEEGFIPAEIKRDSFGWLDGRIVAIDYG